MIIEEGKKIERLLLIKKHHTDKHGNAYWMCKCICGKEKVILSNAIRSGATKSCGCLHKEIIKKACTKHGMWGTRLYWCWRGILWRCEHKNSDHFKNYGGRGIKVFDPWHSFLPFMKWALTHGYSDKLTIDRIDNNGNYEPNNCKWSTPIEQQANRRITKNV
jgi:hypothetical protein